MTNHQFVIIEHETVDGLSVELTPLTTTKQLPTRRSSSSNIKCAVLTTPLSHTVYLLHSNMLSLCYRLVHTHKVMSIVHVFIKLYQRKRDPNIIIQ